MINTQRSKKRQKREGPSTNNRVGKMLQVACYLCRRRKTRCDGGRPACANCVEKGELCIYETNAGESRGAAMRRENEALQIRVNQLETEAEASKASSTSNYSGGSSERGSNIESFQSFTEGLPSHRSGEVAPGHTFSRAIDLLHAMATSSDQDASMLLAKLRSGYSWEQLASETQVPLGSATLSKEALDELLAQTSEGETPSL